MSWFSDLAKTALNEAQKRIDKVLDIEEDNLPKTDAPSSLIKSELKAIQNEAKTPLTPATLNTSSTSAKPNLGMIQPKKRNKPVKLGCSLSKKSSENKANKLSHEKKESPMIMSSPVITTNSPSEFEDVPLGEAIIDFDSKATNSCNNVPKNLVEPSKSDLSSPFSHGDQLDYTSSMEKQNFSDSVENIPTKSSMTTSEPSCNVSPPPVSVSPAIIASQLEESQPATDTAHSPCGSTTASSEIEILDHDSTVSEPSTIRKLDDVDDRLHAAVADASHTFRMSPDPAESEDASDIGRVSGYCSSPLSFGSSEGVPTFNGHSNLAARLQQVNDTREEGASFAPVIESSSKEEQSLASATSGVENKVEICDGNPLDDVQLNGDLKDAPSSVLQLPEDVGFLESQPEKTAADTEKTEILDTSDEKDEESEKSIVNLSSTNSLPDDSSDQRHLKENSLQDIAAPCLSDSDMDVPEIEISHSSTESSKKLEVYEQQLLSLSMSNAKLNEENDNLRNELSSVKIEEKREFERQQQNLFDTIENLSKKIQELELDRSEMSDQLITAQTELSIRLTNEQIQNLLVEKEDSIKGLLQEGEVLSKKHLQLNNAIKKLRSKLAEREALNKDLNETTDKLTDENKTLKAQLAEVQGQSSEDRGAAKRLSEAYQEREAEINEMRSRLEDAEEKKRASEAALDSAHKDLAELNKKLATTQNDREAELKLTESAVISRMHQEKDKLQQEHEHQLHMIMLQVGELRDELERKEAIYARKEDQLRKETADLLQRLQESEMRNQELSESISESTRPILRQMENLQTTHSTQSRAWEALEKSLTSRLGDAQVQLVASQEKERSLQMSLVDLKSRIAALEQQLSESRGEKTSLDKELKQLRLNTGKHDQEIARVQELLELSEKNAEEMKTKSRRERVTLENQLDMEKVRSEVERRKFTAHIEALQKEKERLVWMTRSDSVVSSASALNADIESTTSSNDTFNNAEVFERQSSNSGFSTGIYDSFKLGANSSALLENLQSQIKMRDGEIAQLQGEINTLERTRASMAEEIVRLTNENEDFNQVTKRVEELKIKLKEMKARHEAVLTMYGEKAEEAEELRLDLEDVKALYRNQIDALLKSQ